jgi:hypothetical protein
MYIFSEFSYPVDCSVFGSFPILPQHLFRLFLCCLNKVSLFVYTAILCFRRLRVLFLKKFDFVKHFMFLFSHRHGKFTFARNR